MLKNLKSFKPHQETPLRYVNTSAKMHFFLKLYFEFYVDKKQLLLKENTTAWSKVHLSVSNMSGCAETRKLKLKREDLQTSSVILDPALEQKTFDTEEGTDTGATDTHS